MGEKLVVGPVNKGLQTNRTPFVIDNDSFPNLVNAYQWRGRIKRKRGTTFLTRLQRFLGTTNGAGNLTITIAPTPITQGISTFNVIGVSSTDIFIDPGVANPSTLLTNGAGSATLNLTTGVLTITGSQPNAPVIYFPTLPVMDLEEFTVVSSEFPFTIAFDTVYSYSIPVQYPYTAFDVSFYKNPPSSGTYVQKATWTPVTWNGQDYQQYWSVNYQGAMWVTNGIQIPFSITNIGMQYAGPSTTPALTAATRTSATTIQFTITGNPLVVGDFVFANEFTASAGGNAAALNFQTGYVTTAGNTFTVTFPNANIPAGTYTPGILQYLTNRSSTTVDNIRWFDGNPVTVSNFTPTFQPGSGWVNFMPPISQAAFSIADLPAAQYYLVGARMIVPFKDRLLFFGPVVQTSGVGSQVYLQDTVIYSQNGTPYYTASFTGSPTSATTTFNPLLVPANQIATASAYFSDSTGFGGFITAGIDQAINTVSANEDVLLVGFEKAQSRLVYSGNDILPFNFFLINSEYGSSSTFSAITLDKGAFTIGHRGIIVTSQTGAQRIDLEIPDAVFSSIGLNNNGTERVTAVRDFINEWIYFTYCGTDPQTARFPSQTLLYNYRDVSWGVFNESYTTYGTFRKQTGKTWATLPSALTWNTWNDPWNSSGTNDIFQPDVIAGNQQGFVLFRENEDTAEDSSIAIQFFNGNTVTSPNHGLNEGDYIIINGAFGAISSQVNGKIFSIDNVTQNTFTLDPTISSTGTDYQGGALITRMYIPVIQTKQFPTAWGMSRKTRLGPQHYLLTDSGTGQVTLLIFLSQTGTPFNANGAVNDSLSGPINDGLIYSTILYTCPESTNLGLTASNINLQMVTANAPSVQQQIWHRMNTSLIGDTIQIGITLSDAQLRDITMSSQFVEIELHGFILDISQSMVLV